LTAIRAWYDAKLDDESVYVPPCCSSEWTELFRPHYTRTNLSCVNFSNEISRYANIAEACSTLVVKH